MDIEYWYEPGLYAYVKKLNGFSQPRLNIVITVVAKEYMLTNEYNIDDGGFMPSFDDVLKYTYGNISERILKIIYDEMIVSELFDTNLFISCDY